ncbi:hypothetical protein [Paenibacillus sp. CF384]|uniref:hypothetical protein n=1 Tax=Paenibacillus sp. CF384 TaxID=1884382 RepID=UPI00089D76C4|nr:hypothetical protein [Paenibacillus sp. CF384]SDW18531.1 hypothetical protein SAMN05518855_1001567 [Paenibacillus sp. CF384]
MNAAKALRVLLFGFLIAVLAIGLLPFLVIYNWSELYGLSEVDNSYSPLTFLQKYMK